MMEVRMYITCSSGSDKHKYNDPSGSARSHIASSGTKQKSYCPHFTFVTFIIAPSLPFLKFNLYFAWFGVYFCEHIQRFQQVQG
mmetsp:Transcript_7773/g.10660  ORF Transcript_7773/g.10660 Transcript_7773/m.10660 type:complete len:84 (-) Transcript_7773:467-718(-)